MNISDRIGRRIKLQDLHILMAVARAGSMAKAAGVLNTSQPNISKSIADLEQALGVRVFDRHRQGVRPTEYGRALLEGGIAVFDELQQTIRNIEFLADPTAGELTIGSITPLAASFVSTAIDRMSQRYPRVVFRVVTKRTDFLHRDLLERSVDLLVVRKFGPIADDRLNFEPLFDDSFVVVAGAQSPWAHRRNIRLAELATASWIVLPVDTAAGSIARDAFRVSGLDFPRAAVVTDSSEVRLSLVSTGRYLTILSDSAFKFSTERRELKILPVKLPTTPVPNGIFTLKNRTLGPLANLFIEHAREVAKPLARRLSAKRRP
jgi:DNA-binding transcriptional LysR family regulator